MKVKIINVLGDYRISTITGGFYPGKYATYGDALNKCNMNCFEVVKEFEEKAKSNNTSEKSSSIENLVSTMQGNKNKQISLCTNAIKFDVLKLFTDGNKKTMLTTKQVSEILNVSTQQVSNLLDEGFLSCIDISSNLAERRALRIFPQSLFDFIISRVVEGYTLAEVSKETLFLMQKRINEILEIKG